MKRSGDTPGKVSVPFDTTRVVNGTYSASLRVVKANGDYDEFVVGMTVANGAKQPRPE